MAFIGNVTYPDVRIKDVGLLIYFKGSDEKPATPGPGYNAFITWAAVEKYISGNIGYTYMDGGKLKDPCDSSSQPTFDERYGENKTAGQTFSPTGTSFFNERLPIFPIIDNSDVLLNYIPGLCSTDPFTCVIPVAPIEILTSDNKYNDASEIVSPITSAELKEFRTTLVGTSPNQKIKLKDILVNLRFFLDSYEKTNTLSELLLELLNGISSACGDFWNFQIMITENSKIDIVDTKTVSDDAKQEAEIFKHFKLYNKDSVIRNASISTNVSANIKNSVLLDAFLVYDKRNLDSPKDHQEIGFRHLYDEKVESLLIEDKFRYIYAGENLSSPAAKSTEESNETHKFSSPAKNLMDAYFALANTGRTLETVNRTSVALKEYLAWHVKDSSNPPKPLPHKDFILFPLQLNFSIDGIAGLFWGNKVMIDYLPERYKDRSLFQITNVKHDISINDWITNIETIWRIKQPETLETSSNVVPQASPAAQKVMSSEVKQKVTTVIKEIYEPLRQYLYKKFQKEKPELIITSSFRPENSARKSQHSLGEAIDMQFFTTDSTGKRVNRTDEAQAGFFILKNSQKVKAYDQFIYEKYASNPANQWIHVSYIDEANSSKKNRFDSYEITEPG